MNRIVVSMLVLLAFVAGCSTVPKDDIKIQSDADPKANFSGYKTYGWLGAVGIVNDPEGHWEPPQFDADAEIESLIDEALEKRGISEVDVDPDMLIGYALGVDMAALEIEQDPETKLETLENVPKTALVVALVDTDTGFVIWASVAEAEFKSLEPKAAKERLEYAVNSMFKDLPK